MKKFLVVAFAVILSLALVACGGNKGTNSEVSTVTVAEEKKAETGASDLEKVEVGNKITTDFVELTITEAGMANSLKTSIKNGYITHTFGPDDSAETEYAFIKGKIMNKATETIGKEIAAIAKVGDYTLKEDGLDIYKSDGDTVWELSPLVEYNFTMYVEIPNTLVESMENCDFNFGFSEGLNTSFSEFDEMEYKYSLKITPSAQEPSGEAAQ